MSAMEGTNGQTAPASGTTNGVSNTAEAPAPSPTSIETRQIGIAQISSELTNTLNCEIRGIITLLWPYSSLTKSLALNLAEPDVRLRSDKGQVKISFSGSLGKFVGTQGLGIDDHLVLSLEGAEFAKTTPRDSRDVGWELKYARILRGKTTNRPNGDVVLDHEAQPEIEAALEVSVPVVVEVPSPPRSPPKNRVNAIQNDDGEWSSPAFIKRARLSYGSLMSNDFDNFVGEDGSIPGKGRKKARFEPRKRGTYRYQSESRSPSPEPEKEDTVMAEPEKPKPQMSEMGCQTDDLPYDEVAVQEFFRRSQAIGHEFRQEQHHILQDEGVQTMFDAAEMFSPEPVFFHQPSTTPFGNPPVPLFAQAQAQAQMGSTTPCGEPSAQSTTPMDTLPEHYQSMVSPLAAKSKAPVHQEGQWPSSLFESMGYRAASSLSKSITPASSLRQLQQHESFSPVAPMQSMQPSLQMAEQHNSAAMALEELNRIHQAQQFEDAAVDYSDSTATVLQGSLNEVAPALSPPKQSIQQSMYPELPDQEHAFLTPAKPQFGSRQQSRQQSAEPRSTQHSSRQSPAPFSYPAERYSRERSGTPAQGYTRARSGTPANRGASPADSIDLTGDSDDDDGLTEEYSQDEESDGDQVRPGESFEQTKERLLEEADEESGSDEDGYEGEEGDGENMTEIKIPSWRGQPSMIPESNKRVQDEDSDDEGDMYEGVSDEGDNEDEKMSDGYNFANRGVLLNPRPQRLSPTLNQDADVDEDVDEDADDDARHYYSEPEQPASLQEGFSDDESDESEIEDYSSDANATLDPDNAVMPGEDTEQEWDEEEEESELEHDQEEYARYEGEEEDMGPAYGHSGSQSRAASPPSGPPEVIDLLSSDDDGAAPLQKAVVKPFPSSLASKLAAPIQQDDSGDEDEQLKVQADESMSEGEQEEIAEHQKEIYEEDKEIEEKYHKVGDMGHHSPTPLSAVVVEMVHDNLRAQEAEAMSDADEGKEDATEIAEQERQVYEEEVEDEIRSQEDHDRRRSSPMVPSEEEAESEIGEEGSGYEDEDATAEEVEQPRDMVSMDGASESKHLTSSPAKRLFKNHPANRESSLVSEKVESVEPRAPDDGEQADVEDFEIPKENFDTAKATARPIDPAILAEHDEDRPVPMGISAEVQDEDVAKAHELADETQGESLVQAAISKSQEAAEEAQIAMAAILAERDEDRPVPMGVSAEVQDDEVAQAHEFAARDGDRPVQARQNAISGPSSSARAEAAQLALEDKLDQEVEEDLRSSKDQELTEEAQRDIEMAEVVPPARYDDKTQPPNELEKEIAQDMDKAQQGDKNEAKVMAGVEPGVKGDPEDVDMDGDVVGSDQELEAFSDAEAEPKQKEAAPVSPMVKAGIEPGPRGDPGDVNMDGDVVASDQDLEAFSEAGDAESAEEEASPMTVKSAVEPGPRGDPEDADMDCDIIESDNGLDADDADTQMASSPLKSVPAGIIDDNAEVIVASEVEEAEDEDEEDHEDPSSQLFEEMSYIEQVEHAQTLSTAEEVEETTMAGEESQQTVDSEFIVSSNIHNSVWATQQSQQTQESMEASVFSQILQEETSVETVPHSDAEAAVKEPEVEAPMADVAGIEEVMESVPVDSKMVGEHLEQGPVAADDGDAVEDVEVAPAKHTRSHDNPTPTTPAKKASPAKSQAQVQGQESQPMAMEVDEHPASHTRSHDKHTETKSQIVEMSIEEDEHPASHTRCHDKRVEKLQESDRSGSPAEHTRSHDVLAGHCVEDDESAKGLQGSSRRKSSSRKSTEQPSEQATPSKAPGRAVTPVVEIPVSSAVDDVEETPPKRVTRSRRGTQESVKPASPPKTRKRALTPVFEVEVEVPAASIEETAPEPIEEEAAPEPPKRVTRSRQNTAEPENRSPSRTRKTRRRSLAPVVEVPASSLENVQGEAAPEPPKRTARGRKASNASVTKAVTPPRTRRMSLRSQASPDTTNMTEESASVQLQAIDEEDDELPDPGAAALLEYDESPEKVRAKPSATSAPPPARNTRARGNASPELESSGQPVLETPIKTRARALRFQSLSQGSAMTSFQLAVGLAHETPNQPRDPVAEAPLEATAAAAPMTPANKSSDTPLGSPSTWTTLTPSAVAAQITKTLRTQLPAYTPLKNIKNHLKKKIDVIAVCVDTPVQAVKSKHTPHDYALKFFVTEPGSIGTVKEVTAFHHFKKCLPEMRAGNVLLLRNFLVDGQNNGCLRSEKDSSWAVWRKEGEAPETKSDVPLEFEGGEDGYAKQLKVWWEEKVEGASKEKMKTLAHKAAGKK